MYILRIYFVYVISVALTIFGRDLRSTSSLALPAQDKGLNFLVSLTLEKNASFCSEPKSGACARIGFQPGRSDRSRHDYVLQWPRLEISFQQNHRGLYCVRPIRVGLDLEISRRATSKFSGCDRLSSPLHHPHVYHGTPSLSFATFIRRAAPLPNVSRTCIRRTTMHDSESFVLRRFQPVLLASAGLGPGPRPPYDVF